MSLRSIPAAAPSLPELQRAIAARILTGASRAAPLGALAAWLVAAPGAQLAERLAVYVGGYPARLGEALREQYPAVAHVLGPTRFAALVDRYRVAARLSASNINAIGAELPAFLVTDVLAGELPFLSHLAGLEWSVLCAFHAAHAAPLDVAALRDHDPAALARRPLRLQPSVAVHVSQWPLHALWTARQTPLAEIDIDLSLAEAVLVRRTGCEVRCEAIAADEAAALQALIDGATLAALAESLADRGADPARVGTWVAGWMRRGLFAAAAARADRCGQSSRRAAGTPAP